MIPSASLCFKAATQPFSLEKKSAGGKERKK
jgi:hypothetical protein